MRRLHVSPSHWHLLPGAILCPAVLLTVDGINESRGVISGREILIASWLIAVAAFYFGLIINAFCIDDTSIPRRLPRCVVRFFELVLPTAVFAWRLALLAFYESIAIIFLCLGEFSLDAFPPASVSKAWPHLVVGVMVAVMAVHIACESPRLGRAAWTETEQTES